MSYPEDLGTSKNIQDLLFRKEFAQLNLASYKYSRSKKDKPTNELILDQAILAENLMILHSHQLFVKNLINPDTPYIRLLLKHATGTGKTIAALCIAVQFIKYYQLQFSISGESAPTPMVYIIGFSKQIFQKELLRRPEFGFITKEEISEYKRLRYLADAGSQSDREIFIEFEARIKKRLSKKSRGGFFKFYGYKEFFNRMFIFDNSGPLQKSESAEELLTEDQILQGLREGTIKLNLDLIDSFANSVVICDEIHNVYNSSEMNNYGIALQMLFNIFDMPERMNELFNIQGQTMHGRERMEMLRNSLLRVLFMSATPINNSPTEIIDLLNLLIPLSRLPNQKRLEKGDFFEDNRNLHKGALEKIRSLIQGYISFLRDDNPKYFPEKKYEGEPIKIPKYLLNERVSFYKEKIIPYLKFIRCPMSVYHQKTYDATMKQSETESLPPDGQTLLDMVLPNPGLLEEGTIGLFRTKDIKYNLLNADQTWKDKNKISLDKIPETNTYQITGDFLKYENLKYYSTKYSAMLEDVFDNLHSDKGKIIISHQLVKMAGVLAIQEIFRRNGILDESSAPTDNTLCSKCGYTRAQHGTKLSKAKDHEFIPARFITYYGDLDKPTLDKSLEKFHNPDNVDGYSFRILVGSKIINEGIDFKAVRNMYVMFAPTNYATLLQILGRAIRQNSHLQLSPEKRKVCIRIYVSSMRGKTDKLSYEEHKYFEKSQDYLVIQQIEKVFNENAIDAVIHRDIIMPSDFAEQQNKKNKQITQKPKKQIEDDLGTLYFEPSPIFGKKLLAVSEHKDEIKLKDVSLSTFRTYHSDEEIEVLIYIIKRMFIEQSTVWKYDDLWEMVRHPPFDIYVNPELFLEENFIIALHLLTESQNKNIVDMYQFTNGTRGNIARLFDNLDRRIILFSASIDSIKKEVECKIIYLDGYYMLFPVINTEEEPEEETEKSSMLGISSVNLSGFVDIDLDNWYRQSEDIENTSFRITKYLKTSNISYNQMKFKFYNQFHDYAVEELPTSVEVYDLDFHSKLVEDSIRYAFNILTNPDMPFSELHDFYFKMLYFYDRLDLILFADHLEDTKLIDNYKKYITHVDLKFDVFDPKELEKDEKTKKRKEKKEKGEKEKTEKQKTEKPKSEKEKTKKHHKIETLAEQHKYNPFLMTSILKTNRKSFNINRLNDFLGHRERRAKHPKLEDMNVSKQIGVPRKTIHKVFSNMLPVGHFLNTSMESGNIIAIPKIYLPDSDEGTFPWVRAYEFVQHYEPVNTIENDIIVGYYEKNPVGIDIKFKLRLPVQKIVVHDDTRMIERGSACGTRKKDDLIRIAQELDIDVKKLIKNDASIRVICNSIKLELMYREMNERRKASHLSKKEKDYKRTRWFYLQFEPQL